MVDLIRNNTLRVTPFSSWNKYGSDKKPVMRIDLDVSKSYDDSNIPHKYFVFFFFLGGELMSHLCIKTNRLGQIIVCFLIL